MEQFIQDLAQSLGSWAYLLVGFMAMAETAALAGLSAVHWLSDVGGGWAVGLAVFSACGCIALVLQYLRSGVSGPTAAGAPR
jgi:hypothetical protein